MPEAGPPTEDDDILDVEDIRILNALIGQGNGLVNRLFSSIDSLNGRIAVLMGFILTTTALCIGILASLYGLGVDVHPYSLVVFVIGIGGLLISLGVCLYIWKPSDYPEMSIFDDGSFRKLTTKPEKKVLSDILFHQRLIYTENKEIYDERIEIYGHVYYAFIVCVFVGVGSIITMII